MRRALLGLVLATSVGGAPVGAGSWPVGDGGLYASVTASYQSSDELATPSGAKERIPEFERRELSLYVEYGLSDRWTAIVKAPLAIDSSIEGFGSAHGPGDLAVALQRQILARGPWVLAGRATVQAPTGDEELGRSLLPTGSGVWEGEATISVGRSFRDGAVWSYLDAGHRVRGSGLSDAFAYRLQFGGHVGRRVDLAWNVSGIEPYEERSGRPVGAAAGLGDGVRFLAWGPQLLVGLRDRWSVDAQLERTSRARNLATGTTVRLGLSFKR